jgi:GT2 family glycosyltransferase
MQLSIVIVSWNTADLLLQCLASIYEHAPQIDFETFVVDNASTDGSGEAVRARYPQVTLIANPGNVGFSRANNQAIRASSGRYVLLLNPDTKVLPGALETLTTYMDAHPQTGGLGARILNPDGTLQESCYPAPTLPRELWRLLHLDVLWPYGVYRMAAWDTHTPRHVEAVLGACLLVRRAAFDQVGLLDEDYFFTAEEIDLCTRLRRAGWQVEWTPDAQVIHYGGQSSRQVAEKSFLHLYAGKVLYFRKQHSAASAFIYKGVLYIATLARLGATPLAWLERAPRRDEHLTLAAHYRRLLAALPGM